MQLRFSAELWAYGGDGSWHFVSMPLDLSDDLRARTGARRGFGSIRVRATIGATTWTTSLFPSKTGPYVLPIKRAVREGEAIDVGDVVDVTVDVLG